MRSVFGHETRRLLSGTAGDTMEPKNWIWCRYFVAAAFSAAIPFAAYGQCNGEDISSYMQSGATADQLGALCGQQGQAQAASVCVTPWGACQMAAVLPAGGSCACYTQQGAIPGVAR
jgi:hypothetical protein